MRFRYAFPGLVAWLGLSLGAGSAMSAKWPGRAGGDSASGDPEVLLTFDDGPHEKHTERILDALEEHGLHAIFFWTGHRVVRDRKGKEERLALVARAVEGGHLVGNHTSTHAKLCKVSAEAAEREIDENEVLYEQLTGLPMLLFRVPYGARCKRLDTMLADREREHLHWDIDPQEFRHHSADVAFRYVTKRMARLQPGMRAILLMHDTQPATAKALPKILKWIVKENKKREERGKRPIRVLDGSAWLEDMHPVPLLNWTRASATQSEDALIAAASKLIPRSAP